MIDETVVGKKKAQAKKSAKKAVAKSNGKSHGKSNGKAKEAAPKKVGGLSSGAFIRECIAKDMDTDAILAANLKRFPESKAKACDVSWNRGYAERLKEAKKTSKKK